MERMSVKEVGFCGIYHKAEEVRDSSKIVIVVGGSEGNDNIPLNIGKMFSDKGIDSLGICYWNVEGLPSNLNQVPVDPFEKVISWSKNRGYNKIFIYGISKGAELALLVASIIPDICGVIALSPMHCIWSGMKGNDNMTSKTFADTSEFTWRGRDFPCMKAELKYGEAIKNLFLQQQFNLKYMYENPLRHFREETAIQVENINGDILFIYAIHDLMWPSKCAVEYMINRLKRNQWEHQMEVLEYEKASHILVPLNTSKLKMFKVERKYPTECKKNREDAFQKTIAWIDKK